MVTRVERAWGYYEVLAPLEASPLTGLAYKVKLLVINPGCAISLQTHEHRAEHWVFMGHGVAEVRGERHPMKPMGCIFIKAGDKHRAINPGDAPLRIMEVQHGDYLGEDDIVRHAPLEA
jgi:mannose-1-phosphate guanylyltransferase / mannose-6-phosphate isomerase